MSKLANGIKRNWELLDVLGEGDAGQVLRVRAENSEEFAVMKRPIQNASGGTIVRQAAQIENEGKVLAKLNGLNARHAGIAVTTPILLDQSIPGTERSANLFMVSQQAPGVAIARLLKGNHHGGNVISQVLALKILAALLQMLKAVHALDLIWNDVKMEHVYWDAENNSFCFIDWGNSLAVEGTPEEKAARFKLDYEQLFPEGVLLIRQTAPELLQEISWPVDGKTLNPTQLTELQFRTEFAAEYYSNRVIEYKLLFRKSLEKTGNLESLQDLFSLRNSLEDLGVKSNDQDLLEAARNLALKTLRTKGFETLRSICETTLSAFSGEKTQLWQLTMRLLQDPKFITLPKAKEIFRQILNQDPGGANWNLANLDAQALSPGTKETAQFILREIWPQEDKEKAIASNELQVFADELHMMALRAAKQNTPQEVREEIARISSLIDPLRAQWNQLEEGQLFGHQFLSLREAIQTTPIRPQARFNVSLNFLMRITREAYKAWGEADFEQLSQSLQKMLLADPSLTHLIQLQERINDQKKWNEALSTGPDKGESINRFAKRMIEKFPKAHFYLGLPEWLEKHWQSINTLAASQDLQSVQELANQEEWKLPWLQLASNTIELPDGWVEQFRLQPHQTQALESFHRSLQSDQDRSAALSMIAKTLPAFHRSYAKIDDIFKTAFSQSVLDPEIPDLAKFPPEDRQNVEAALLCFHQIETWQQAMNANQARRTQKPGAKVWKIKQEMDQVQESWQKTILPVLLNIKQKNWPLLPNSEVGASNQDHLIRTCYSLSRAYQEWNKIPSQGLYKELVDELQFRLENAQSEFFKFWKSLELDPRMPMRWVADENQALLSGIHRNFLLMIRQVKNIGLAYGVINTPEIARTGLAHASAGDLMFGLVQLETYFEKPSRKASVFRDWQKQYLWLQKGQSRTAIIEGIKSIESIHPLLPWFDELVRRDADFFNISSI